MEITLRGRIQGLLKFFGIPNYLRNRYSYELQILHAYSINRKKNPLKISWKVAVGIVRDSRKCQGTHI